MTMIQKLLPSMRRMMIGTSVIPRKKTIITYPMRLSVASTREM